jgi:hypothetical protein
MQTKLNNVENAKKKSDSVAKEGKEMIEEN